MQTLLGLAMCQNGAVFQARIGRVLRSLDLPKSSNRKLYILKVLFWNLGSTLRPGMEYLLHRYQHGGVSKTCFLWLARLLCSESKGVRACSGPSERRRAGLRSSLARRDPGYALAIASTKICRSQGLGLRYAAGRATNCARPTGHGCAGVAGARTGLVRKTPGS